MSKNKNVDVKMITSNPIPKGGDEMNISFDKKNGYLALSLLLILIGIKTNPVILLLGIFAGIKGFLELKDYQ